MRTGWRRLLLCTLGGLLLLTAAAGGAGLAVFSRIRAGEAALRARYRERSGRLERVRAAVYLSATLARDYFADPAGENAPALLARLARLEAASREDLDRYGARDAAAATLRGEFIAYWRVLGLMTDMARRQPSAGVDAYFRAQLAGRRETMERIADGVGEALERERREAEAELARMYGDFGRILTAGLVLTVLLGAAVATLTARRLLRLQAEARALSAQVVAAQERERRAIARELHDEVGQALTGLLLDVGAAAALAGEGAAKARLEAAAATAERTVEEVRRIALSLRPSMLDDLGLVAALEWQAREVGARSGLAVKVEAEEAAGDLPDEHRTCIYRVAQEALQNCVRHARAKQVRVALRREGATVRLRVEDDGRGFAAGRTRGLGLLGMEERVAQLGGRLRVASEPGRGATVVAELPV
jgi:signal transduction histidine kinase